MVTGESYVQSFQASNFSGEQVPGLAEGLEGASAGAMRADADGLASAESAQRDDVPGAGGNDAGGDEVEFAGRVAALAAVATGSLDLIEALLRDEHRLDLHAKEAPAVVHDEVIRAVLAEGLRNPQPEREGAEQKTHFRPLALGFGGKHWFQHKGHDGTRLPQGLKPCLLSWLYVGLKACSTPKAARNDSTLKRKKAG